MASFRHETHFNIVENVEHRRERLEMNFLCMYKLSINNLLILHSSFKGTIHYHCLRLVTSFIIATFRQNAVRFMDKPSWYISWKQTETFWFYRSTKHTRIRIYLECTTSSCNRRPCAEIKQFMLHWPKYLMFHCGSRLQWLQLIYIVVVYLQFPNYVLQDSAPL